MRPYIWFVFLTVASGQSISADDGIPLTILKGHDGAVWSIAMSPNGNCLASAAYEGSFAVRLWDRKSGRGEEPLKCHGDLIFALAFSPDGKLLVSVSADGTMILWDFPNRRRIATVQDPGEGIISMVAVSPDGKHIAYYTQDSSAFRFYIWDVQHNKFSAKSAGIPSDVNHLVFSPDSSTVALACDDGRVRTYDVKTATEIKAFQGVDKSTRPVLAAAFTPDGKELLSVGRDKKLRRWTVIDGKESSIVLEVKGDLYKAAFTSDCSSVATADVGTAPDVEGNVRIWETKSGKKLAFFEAHSVAVCSLMFSHDGRILASGSQDRTIKLWNTAIAGKR